MKKPKQLKRGDRVAVVSLSSGLLGEGFCAHNVEIGVKRLEEYGLEAVFMPHALKGIEFVQEHPECRAADLKQAFADDSIQGIICAVGGDDTYRTLPYLMEDEEFRTLVVNHPKIFTGFSDTTINHLMFSRLGLTTYYGACFLCDLGEIGAEMLPYTRNGFEAYLAGHDYSKIEPSPVWYEERTDFSADAIGTPRISHPDERGFEVLQGEGSFQGKLSGGCMESLYDMLTDHRYRDQKEICEKYHLIPDKSEWKDKILFLETCEEKPTPEMLAQELSTLKQTGIFETVQGVLIGKPDGETYYEEYREVFCRVIDNPKLPVLYNVNFGHAYPRCMIPYGIETRVDCTGRKITFLENLFGEESVDE